MIGVSGLSFHEGVETHEEGEGEYIVGEKTGLVSLLFCVLKSRLNGICLLREVRGGSHVNFLPQCSNSICYIMVS
jgi:hypothetical protein